MSNLSTTIQSALRQLESTQSQVGEVQLALLELMTDDTSDNFAETIQEDLLRLESVQRIVGEAQKNLFVQLHRSLKPTAQAVDAAMQFSQPVTSLAQSTWVNPRAWLESRNITVKRVRQESGLDGAANRVAQYLGDHFTELHGFYGAIKGRVSKANTWRWYPLANQSPEAVKHVLKFGSMLHDCGFLSAFRFTRNDSHVQFEPMDDPRVTNFLTGGWLEHYAFHLARNIIQNKVGGWSDDQALCGVEIQLPDGSSTEFDMLIGLPADVVLWVECKTGEWGDYIKHFQTMNNQYLHLPQTQSVLVLASELADDSRLSVGELAAMSVVHLSDLGNWFSAAAERCRSI
jgi:hypothetical protein